MCSGRVGFRHSDTNWPFSWCGSESLRAALLISKQQERTQGATNTAGVNL